MTGKISVSIAPGTVVRCGHSITGGFTFTNTGSETVSLKSIEAEVMMTGKERYQWAPATQPWPIAPGETERSLSFTVYIRPDVGTGEDQLLVRVHLEGGSECTESVNLQIDCDPSA